jgi:arylsulfatase A-like enzyme/Flp pilus assembly protein TadD
MAAARRRRDSGSGTPPSRSVPGRGRAWLVAGIAVVALVAAGVALMRSRRVPPRPNVLLITIDTLRADHLGCYGDAGAATPVLDALAARGVRFATAIAQAPLTAPSHASILTGRTPLAHGLRDNGAFVLPEKVPTLAAAFQAAGYRTAAFVSGFPLDRRFGLARGFDSYDDRFQHGDDPHRAAYVERPADQTTRAVLQWLGNHSSATDARWFLWVHYFDPHAPYAPPPEIAARFPGRLYDGEVAFVDSQIGALLRSLEATGAMARTLVLATADHGESLGEHGELTHGVFVYDATLKVPLILAGPGVSAGLVSATVARSIDIAPTLADLASVPVASGTEGRSLRPALSGRAMSDEPAYAEALFSRIQLGWAPLHAWRTARWKVIDAPRPELYALDSDPGEKSNRVEQSPSVKDDLLQPLRAALTAGTPTASAPEDASVAERLAALGYLGAARTMPAADSPRDPKDGIGLINRLERGIAEARANPEFSARELAAILLEEPRFSLARRYRAIALAATRDYAGAIRELHALERDGPLPAADLVFLGDYLRLSGQAGEARDTLERAASLEPRAPEPLLSLARTFIAQGQPDQAAAAFERVLAVVPGHPDALRGLGDLALGREDLVSAERYYDLVLKGAEYDAGAMVKIGVIDVRKGQLDAGIALFQKAVALDPTNAEALLDLASALAKSGRHAEADPYFERALALAPAEPSVERSVLIGATRFLQGRFAEAAGAYQSALDKAPAPTPELLNGLAWAQLKLGHTREAALLLRRSLALNQSQPEIDRLLAQLRSAPAAP